MDEATQTELRAQLILQRAPGITGAVYLRLIEIQGSATAILAAGESWWRAQALGARTLAYLNAPPDVRAHLAWLSQPEHALVMIDAARYPMTLAQLPDAPVGLFARGAVALLSTPQLALVGSRNPTPYGREAATAFARHLSLCGLTITSGLAAGIDAASHRGALQGSGHTVAVCGTGLDQVYPPSSRELAQDIAATGLLVSEYPPGTPPRQHHFPRRNRIISGLSLGTVVFEAAPQSGSLITAQCALEQGREVFALPGSIHSTLSKGCHQLIREGAKLVETADDILSELGPLHAALHAQELSSKAKVTDLAGFSETRLDKDYEILLDALGFDPAGVDQLVLRSGLKADVVASMLLILELNGAVTSYPGGLYARCASG